MSKESSSAELNVYLQHPYLFGVEIASTGRYRFGFSMRPNKPIESFGNVFFSVDSVDRGAFLLKFAGHTGHPAPAVDITKTEELVKLSRWLDIVHKHVFNHSTILVDQ